MEIKSLRELSLDITEPEYRDIDAISYSMLSTFQREGFRNISHLYDRKSSPSLTFGSIVDTMLTDGMDEFERKFIVCEFPELSDSLKVIADCLVAMGGDVPFEELSDSLIDSVCVQNNYYKADKYKNYRIKNVRESCGYYYKLWQTAKGRTVISQKDYDDALNCMGELKTNPYTKYYFTDNPFEDIERLFQLKFMAEFNGIPIKCMPDLVIIDHTNKEILPCDLKTTSSPEEVFGEHSFYKWRYMYQAQMYTYIMQEVIKNDPYFKNFKIKSYRFIVINRNTLSPLVWHYDRNFSCTDITDNNGDVIPAWRKVLEELNYYREYYKKNDTYPKYPYGLVIRDNMVDVPKF